MPVKRVDWSTIDPELRRIYRERQLGGVKQLSEQVNLHHATLCKRALTLGLRTKHRSAFGFTEKESQLMMEHYSKPLAEIQRILVKHGFKKRSKESLSDRYVVMRKHGWIPSIEDALMERNCYSLLQVCELMGVGEGVVRRWINHGLLKSVGKPPPGEQMMFVKPIRRRALHDFMKRYPGHWDSHKCNHLWLVDILTSPDLYGVQSWLMEDSAGKSEREIMYRDL